MRRLELIENSINNNSNNTNNKRGISRIVASWCSACGVAIGAERGDTCKLLHKEMVQERVSLLRKVFVCCECGNEKWNVAKAIAAVALPPVGLCLRCGKCVWKPFNNNNNNNNSSSRRNSKCDKQLRLAMAETFDEGNNRSNNNSSGNRNRSSHSAAAYDDEELLQLYGAMDNSNNK